MTSRMWFLIPGALVLLVVITVWMAKSQTAPLQMYEGKDAALVTLTAPGGGGVEAARGLLERLRNVGISAEVIGVGDSKLELRLRRVAEAREAVGALIDPEPLRVYVIALDQHVVTPDGGERDAGEIDANAEERVLPWRRGTSRADIHQQLQEHPAPGGHVPVIECVHADGEAKGSVLCAAWLTTAATTLGAKHVTEAKIGAHARTEEPIVTLTLDAEGTRALEALTTANMGRMLAIVAFGELQARPLVDAAITDGKWSFSTRTGDTDRRTSVERAQRLTAAARARALPPLVLESVEPVAPGPPPR